MDLQLGLQLQRQIYKQWTGYRTRHWDSSLEHWGPLLFRLWKRTQAFNIYRIVWKQRLLSKLKDNNVHGRGSHQMKSKLEGRTCNRLKRESFGHRVKNISRSYLGHLPTLTSQPLLHQSNPWEDTRSDKVTICTKIPQISSEDPQADFINRNIAEDHCDERFPL